MRHTNQTYFAFIILSVILFACHSKENTAHASPPFNEVKKLSPIQLLYADTNNAETKKLVRRLDSFYVKQSHAGFNGSVLVGYKGKILYERYFGYCNYEKRDKLTSHCGVQLASVSKTFTGAVIMFLNQHRYLNIEDPVQKYIKEFPYPNITIKMLLCHRSGLPDYTHWAPQFWGDERRPMYNADLQKLMTAHKPPLEFRPNTRFKYSNTNYATLASIIEKVTEMNYRDFMRHYVFEPLGMASSFVFNPATDAPTGTTVSYKYNWRREPIVFSDGVYGDKGIYSTVEDMYRWDQSFYNNSLLSQETLDMAYTPYSHEKKGVKNYGLGWRMLCFPNGGKVIYHNGWWHGNNTSFYRFIQDNFTIIVLGNKFNNSIYHQAPVILSIVRNTPMSGEFDTGG
ncbi:MAG: serine hydrolase domain-containing protein [Bacteroidota bacterium]